MSKTTSFNIACAGALAAIIWSLPAPAQLAPGFSGSSSQLSMDGGEAMRTLRAFGNCYAMHNAEEAWALLATEPGSRDEAETFRRLFRRDSQGCLGEASELQVPVFMTRGAIAEALYRRRVAVPARLQLARLAPDSTVRTLSEVARCYASAHPDQVRTLIENTAPNSRPEHVALGEMAADFFRCVPESARGRGFGATQIRYRLAEALLRMAAPAS